MTRTSTTQRATLLLPLSLLGCGLVQVTTNGEPAAGAEGGDDSVSAVYQRWSYTDCPPKKTCEAAFERAAGYAPDMNGDMPNPKPTMDNPDPTWLVGWDQLSDGSNRSHHVFQALSVAATNRSWLSACADAYQKASRAVDDRLDTARAGIAEARPPLTRPKRRSSRRSRPTESFGCSTS